MSSGFAQSNLGPKTNLIESTHEPSLETLLYSQVQESQGTQS